MNTIPNEKRKFVDSGDTCLFPDSLWTYSSKDKNVRFFFWVIFSLQFLDLDFCDLAEMP